MNGVCAYGCEKPAAFLLRNGNPCCSKSYQSCEAVRRKNAEGGRRAYAEGKRKGSPGFNIASRKQGYASRIANIKQRPFEYWGRVLQYRHVFEEQQGRCLKCGIGDWQGQPIKLEYDHVDGSSLNNKRENIRLLCPNCHSQTETFRGRNINSGRIKVSDEEMLAAYHSCSNIHQALIKLGLSPRGANYHRMKKLLSK